MESGRISVVPASFERLERPSPKAGAKPTGFAAELGQAVGHLEAVQLSADREAESLANGGGNLHEATLALEKADVSMRLATKVRNKFVEAYQEIMRMNV